VFVLIKDNPEARQHFQDLVKRTLGTLNTALAGKTYLVDEKCTIADLAFVNWDLVLDVALKRDKEAATKEQREKMFPNWAAWRARLFRRPAVQKMVEAQKAANA
jgi:glutathione S-transferase